MTGIVAAFKALSLDAQTEAYPQITAAFNAAKDARRLQREAEIRQLGFRPGEGKKPGATAVKFLSKKDRQRDGAGEVPLQPG
jgi:hypothetical protein